MTTTENVRIIEFAKANEYRRYERVYVLFLWVSSIGIIGIGLVVTAGVIYMLSKEYYILIAGECKAFVYSSAFLLCAGILALMSGILTCAVTTSKGKFVITIFFGHIFAFGLVISGLILAAKMSKMVERNGGKNSILDNFRLTLNDTLYQNNWMRIHRDFNCCTVDSLEAQLGLVEDTNTTQKITFNSTNLLDTNSPKSSEHLFSKLYLVAHQLGARIDYCVNILRDAHRGCGVLLLNRLEKKTNLLKFYATLILPMIFIADMLFFLGYLCFRDIKISLTVDARN